MSTENNIPEGYTEEEFNRLGKDEQDALRVTLDDDKPTVSVEEGSDEHKAAEAKAKLEADTKAAADAKVAADKDAADKAAAAAAAGAKPAADAGAQAAAAQAEETEGSVADALDPKPVIPTIKAEKIISDEEHATAQAALAKKFEDGDISTPQFILENDRLTRAKLESDLATRSAGQSDQLAWEARQDAFFSVPGNEIIRDDPRVWAAMQAQLETMYADPALKDYSDMQFLNAAGREVRKLFGLEPTAAAPAAAAAAAPAKKPAGTAVDAPTTLADAPSAAEHAGDGRTEFDHLDKLEGMEFETAVAKLTPEQKARYLAI